MPTAIRSIYRGLEILEKYNKDPDICFDQDIGSILVNVGIELSSEDNALMHTYGWFSVLDKKSWRVYIDLIGE